MQSFDTESEDSAHPSNTECLVSVCPTDALSPGMSLRLPLANGDELAVYNISGEFYATDNFCPHRGAPLSDGAVVGHLVECSWHGWQFDVRNGDCLTVPEKIKTFEVRVIDGMIYVSVD